MFSYYGGKGKIVSWYPAPRYPTIIEPFAGSAKYALFHAQRTRNLRVILVENNPVITGIWRWVINASQDEISDLPIPGYKEKIPDVTPLGARNFLAMMANQGSAAPRNVAGSTGGFKVKSWERIVKLTRYVRMWEIIDGNYSDAPDIAATWFIDPPYCGQSLYPTGKNLDYALLAKWCKTRRGQVIVAENDTATWLPFKPLGKCSGQRSTSKLRNEGIWVNNARYQGYTETAGVLQGRHSQKRNRP